MLGWSGRASVASEDLSIIALFERDDEHSQVRACACFEISPAKSMGEVVITLALKEVVGSLRNWCQSTQNGRISREEYQMLVDGH